VGEEAGVIIVLKRVRPRQSEVVALCPRVQPGNRKDTGSSKPF